MKSYKMTFTVTCSDEYFEKEVLPMKSKIESGEVQKEMFRDKDREQGMTSLMLIFEELSL